LVARDDHVEEGEDAGEDIILNDAIGEIPEEQVGLLLIHVQHLGLWPAPAHSPPVASSLAA
jgi:hypothetical protein